MPVTKRNRFADSEAGVATAAALKDIELDTRFHTVSSFSANSTLYPDNVISFVDKHMDYLSQHPETNPEHYLANIRLKTRVRS